MRVLHLAYEDPRQPGSGGGSVRTREINRRLAARHEITAIVAGYPDACERVEDGVRWVPVGLRTGTKLDQLSYFAAIAREVRRRPHDLVVEDFGAPFSTGFSPRFTTRPVVASVQWLFASEMRRKYRVPFDWVERAGLPLYRDFIAVSGWLAGELRVRQPAAAVAVIPNGIEPLAFATAPAPPSHFLFVGRLDVEQKGGDLLIEIAARIKQTLGAGMPRLVIVGDGPGRAAMERQARSLNVADVVEFRGRVAGEAKYQLMAAAYAVLMPSRFETFGMVAVEAQAAGAPVVAFDIGPLADVAGGGGARLVPPFDVGAAAREAVALVQDGAARADLRDRGRAWARRYDWDILAAKQEQHYEAALDNARVGRARGEAPRGDFGG